ncbi:MAG: uracil-DNA glycosylase [Bacteroidota bacterium]
MTDPAHPSKDSRERLLADLELILKEEREHYGETLLAGGRAPRRAAAAPIRELQEDEPSLFKGPAPERAPWEEASSLASLEEMISGCERCPLGRTRIRFVFGTGNPRATLMLVGEAPGADEDAQGEPFVGRAGQLLNKILEAIGFRREEVYICNILKCRPPENRAPQASEVEQCLPYLRKQIALVGPKVILCLGLTAAQNLLGTTESLGRLRLRTLSWEGVPVRVTYHPAALLRNPHWKRPAWEDVQAVRALHDELNR